MLAAARAALRAAAGAAEAERAAAELAERCALRLWRDEFPSLDAAAQDALAAWRRQQQDAHPIPNPNPNPNPTLTLTLALTSLSYRSLASHVSARIFHSVS